MSAESTLEQWSELAADVVMQKYPILPKPDWGQDVAYVAFVLDHLVQQVRASND